MAIVTLSAINLNILKPNISLILSAIEMATPGDFLAVECGSFGRRRE